MRACFIGYFLAKNSSVSIDFGILFNDCYFSIFCSVPVLLVPYHFLPLLMEFGGRECATNRAWCPHGLPHRMRLEPSWLQRAVRTSTSPTSIAFLDAGFALLVIGFANAVGRLVASACKLFAFNHMPHLSPVCVVYPGLQNYGTFKRRNFTCKSLENFKHSSM